MNIDNVIKNLNTQNDTHIVIGVSAGPDSMALLHSAITNLNKTIICAHINHNVRTESNEEEKYLEKYCKNNNIIFEKMKINSYKETNFENEARKKRYQFYEKILKKYNSHTLMLAHHGDDLIETIMMKIVRGSNIEGYAGIKMYSQMKDYQIIRPLLYFTKDDLIKYNKDNQIKYYIDSTNDDTNYTRNRYRKNLLPLLKKEDKLVHLKFLKYSQTLQEYNEYIEKVTNNLIKETYKDNIIDIELFKKEHPLIQKNIIFNILKNIYNNIDNIIKEKNISDIIKLANSKKPNAIINLPKEYIAKKEYQYIYIIKKDKEEYNYCIELKDKINIDNITIEKISNCDTSGNNVCKLNSKNITLPIYIRNKKNGDYIELLGTNGKKKISDIFIEKKIPKSIRNKYPILVDRNDKVLWIPNLKKSKYNVKKNEFCDIILTSYTKGDEINEKEKQ